ncbi:M48 family metallopeptidase [Acinetobacter genomosp. 15BJ]|uniref:SprT family zinc-dependent metalloprotease n=1 Tax=Acinetobacter genomosp. 15BJ TaxID=106651 RepID=A0ABT8V2S1_9GAMM|nr:SprT family zinc-dependent metalloprotease [Acinetobacter genomosp. 15BJ]MDO3658204.1 SprT family zinc-dependent metalloprotease [Acinetobacter genomosp. 15BJ]
MPSVSLETLLPEIKVVRHARARNLRLRVEPTGIRLTVPLFCSKRQIQQFLHQSEQWLIETWAKQQQQFNQITVFPESLTLFNHVQPFKIIQQQQRHIFKFDFDQHIIWVRDQQSEQALQAAVLAYAKQFLPEYLAEVSQQIRLPYQQCSIRKPKTRWGSCSSKHDIMLNAALVLMPEHIVRSVCVHELVHTKHFDHSAAFWNEVEKHDVNYLEHRKQLKQTQLPSWYYKK